MTVRTLLLSPDQLARAASVLRDGGVVVFPTDTVYGVAALACDDAAVGRLFVAKNRPARRPIPVMVAEPEQAMTVAYPSPGFWDLIDAFWPGPLTIILPKRDVLPAIVTAGGDTVALRIPDHPLTLALLRLVDAPLAVTSANLSDHPPARTAQEARAQLDGRVDAIVDGGPAPGGQPSTIIDLTLSPPKILRVGPISPAQLQRFF